MTEGTKVWVQMWVESEKSWGIRPDGYTLHLGRKDISLFVTAMRAGEAKIHGDVVPDEYSYPDRDPYEAIITDAEVLKTLRTSEHGIWGPGRTAPSPA